jgi:SnoaL-like domain
MVDMLEMQELFPAGRGQGEGLCMLKNILAIVITTLALSAAHADSRDSRAIAALEQRLVALEHRITLQEDIEQVRIVAFSYGYYMDNVLYDQVKAMFSRNIESCELAGYGVFIGLKGCNRMWTDLIGKPLGADKNQLAFGRLAKHYMIKDVITVAPDGKSAKGRFDYISMGGTFGNNEATGSQIGVYNFGFVKEDGVWKISKFWMAFDTINYNQRDWASNQSRDWQTNTSAGDRYALLDRELAG